jgi:hypothetical protein
MALTNYGVVSNHSDLANSVLISCFDNGQMVLVFIPREAVDYYFGLTALTPQQRNLLISSNLAKIEPVIAGKYDRSEVKNYIGAGGQQFPQIDLALADLRQTNDKLTDSVLGIAAGAGFQGARLAFEMYKNDTDAVREELANRLEKMAEAFSAAGSLDASVASAEQRPAAYRFELRGGKIDVLPELPEPEDRGFALDTYQELVAKARELLERLKGANSARRVRDSIGRLLIALGAGFDDLRPGVLLSRERSIAADRAAFENDEARGELFPDAIAMMDDTLLTLRDLLAVFPIVRRIEAERLALDLDRNPDAIPIIHQQMNTIQAVAFQSGAVTEDAIGALTQSDPDIEGAADPMVRISLIADKLLVLRNFAGAVIGGVANYGRIAGAELGELAGKSWLAIKDELPKGVGAAARIAPLVALVTLAGVVAGPVATIASVVPVFKPIAETLKNAVRGGLKDALADEKKDNPKGKRRGKSR